MTLTPKITELQAEVDQLKNPTDRPPANTPTQSVQLVDRSALMAAWETNVRTQKGVLTQLEIVQRTNMLTRVMVLITVLLNLALFFYAGRQIDRIVSLVHHIDGAVSKNRQLDTVIEHVIIEQQKEAEPKPMGPMR